MRPLAAIFAIAAARMPPAVIGRPAVVEDASSAACVLRRGMRDCSITHELRIRSAESPLTAGGAVSDFSDRQSGWFTACGPAPSRYGCY
jgi:hypothetical protein